MGYGHQPWLHNLTTVLSAPTMVLSEPGGQLRWSGAQGAFHADSRVLCQAVLEVAGAEPAPVSSSLLAFAGSALFTAIPREIAGNGPDPVVWLTSERPAGPGRVYEPLRLAAGGRSDKDAPLTQRIHAERAMLADITRG